MGEREPDGCELTPQPPLPRTGEGEKRRVRRGVRLPLSHSDGRGGQGGEGYRRCRLLYALRAYLSGMPNPSSNSWNVR